MIRRNAAAGLLGLAALTLSISACNASDAVTETTAAPTPSQTAADGTRDFIEAARDRVPLINNSSDEQIAAIGKNICSETHRSDPSADKMTKSMLIIRDQARNDSEAEAIIGLAKQHMCRPE